MFDNYGKYKNAELFRVLDVFVLAIFLAVFSYSMYLVFRPETKGNVAQIYQEEKLVGEFNLNNDQEIIINEVKLTIKDNIIQVEYSTCKDKLCMKTGGISHVGECIVCLPNKIVVVITGKSEVDYLT